MHRTSPLRTHLTVSLLAVSLLAAPAAFAGGEGRKGAQGSSKTQGYERKDQRKSSVVAAPPAVPELDGSQAVSAAALLAGAFLLLASRRRAALG